MSTNDPFAGWSELIRRLGIAFDRATAVLYQLSRDMFPDYWAAQEHQRRIDRHMDRCARNRKKRRKARAA